MNIENITEEEAIDIMRQFKIKFDWVGTLFYKEDIIYRWADNNSDKENYEPLTDDQIEQIMVSYEWRKGMDEAMTETGYEVLDMALWELEPTEDDE